MPWQQRSSRRAPLPSNWPAIRQAVLTRDGRTCQLRGPRCTVVATDVDHMNGPDDHRLTSLRALCSPCHMARTAHQSHEARPSRTRQPERHPGIK